MWQEVAGACAINGCRIRTKLGLALVHGSTLIQYSSLACVRHVPQTRSPGDWHLIRGSLGLPGASEAPTMIPPRDPPPPIRAAPWVTDEQSAPTLLLTPFQAALP